MSDMKLGKIKSDNRSDLHKINEFYRFLTNEEVPDNITLSNHYTPKMTEKKAFAIIWYLQEYLSVFPDDIERCFNCGNLFCTGNSGTYCEKKKKHFCDACEWCRDE